MLERLDPFWEAIWAAMLAAWVEPYEQLAPAPAPPAYALACEPLVHYFWAGELWCACGKVDRQRV